MTAQCKDCKEYKIKQKTNVRRGKGHFVYVDGKGSPWCGLQCPACRLDKKYKRDSKMDRFLGPEIETNPVTKRLCRKCNKPLRANKYFKCEPCTYDFTSTGSGFYGEDDWGYSCSGSPLIKTITNFVVSDQKLT